MNGPFAGKCYFFKGVKYIRYDWTSDKADPGYPGDQRFLATATHPVFPPGRWYTVRVQQRGDGIEVDVDGRRLVRLTDSQHPYRSGRVGLYTEDASVTFQPITVGPAS